MDQSLLHVVDSSPVGSVLYVWNVPGGWGRCQHAYGACRTVYKVMPKARPGHLSLGAGVRLCFRGGLFPLKEKLRFMGSRIPCSSELPGLWQQVQAVRRPSGCPLTSSLPLPSRHPVQHISFSSHSLITANVPYQTVMRNVDLDSFTTHRRLVVGLGESETILV